MMLLTDAAGFLLGLTIGGFILYYGRPILRRVFTLKAVRARAAGEYLTSEYPPESFGYAKGELFLSSPELWQAIADAM